MKSSRDERRGGGFEEGAGGGREGVRAGMETRVNGRKA